MTFKELFDGIKAGTISFEKANKWNDSVYKKIESKITAKLKTDGVDDPETKAALEKLNSLQSAYDELSDSAVSEKTALQRIIDSQKSDIEKLSKTKENELQRLKIDNDQYKKMYLDESLLSTAKTIAKELNLANSDYAALDLVRDGILKAEEVRDKDGKIVDIKIKSDFSYEDDKTKQKITSSHEGNSKDYKNLVEAVRVLATNKSTSYNRLAQLYPIQESVAPGSGAGGLNFGNTGNGQFFTKEQVANMTSEQVAENIDAINSSSAQWKN